MGIAIVAALMAVYFFILKPNMGHTDFSTASWSHSIAVLPFADMSQDQDQEFFCDGMAEEILNALTTVENLRVIARTSAFAFKGKNVDVRDIGKQLGVQTLLEGSVRKAGDRLRVTVQLIRTADGAHIWSDQYDRNLIDVFAIQDEIALSIVNQLKIELLGDEEESVSRRLTDKLEAYHQYLRGRHILNRRKAEDIYTAISYFEKALEIDSLYVMGYIGLADAFALLPAYASVPSQMAFQKSKDFIFKALAINDHVGEAYASLGWIRIVADWDWEGAEQAFQRAIDLNPGYATVYHWYGYLDMILGEFDKSLIKVNRALELDPLSPVINRVIGDVHYYARQYDKAFPALIKCLELEPCLPFAHLVLANCYIQKSMYPKAYEELLKETECRDRIAGMNYYDGIFYARIGEIEKSKEVLLQLQSRGTKNVGLAQLYFELGEINNGFEVLEELYEAHDHWIIYININSSYDSVRSDPRFQDLLKRIGF